MRCGWLFRLATQRASRLRLGALPPPPPSSSRGSARRTAPRASRRARARPLRPWRAQAQVPLVPRGRLQGEVGEVRAAVELVHGRRRRLGALRGVSAVELALEEDDVDVVLPCPGAHSAARGFAKLAPPKLFFLAAWLIIAQSFGEPTSMSDEQMDEEVSIWHNPFVRSCLGREDGRGRCESRHLQ